MTLIDEKIEREKILIVDDSESIIDSYMLLLELEGYDVKGTMDVEQAINILKEEDISLLLLDYYMPKMNAPEFIAKIREFSDIVIILQTGFAGEIPGKELLKEMDIQLYYNKTDDNEILLTLIAAGLKISKVLRQNKEIINNLDKLVNDRTIELRETNEKLKKANEKLEAMVNIDGLTGAYNKGYMNKLIELEKSKLSILINKEDKSLDMILCLIMFDIDYFKNYNDINGHIAGDELLKILVREVKACLRSIDVVCRFGGEEFAIILPDITKENAIKIANRISKHISEYPFPYKETQPLKKVTISMGLAFYPVDDDLLYVADKRLYIAKRQGRDKVIFEDYDEAYNVSHA